MDHFIAYLRGYIEVSDVESEKILSHISTKTFEKGEFILKAGEVCMYHSHIKSGKARTYYADKQGNEHILMFAIENWWVSDLNSFSNQMPAQFNIQCLEKTELVQIHFNQYEPLLREVPIMERFFRIITQRAFASMSKRLVSNHAYTAKERYLLFCEDYPDFLKRVPLYMIASYLGISKEHLSSIRRMT